MMATWLEDGGTMSVTTNNSTKNASNTVTLRDILSPDSGGSQYIYTISCQTNISSIAVQQQGLLERANLGAMTYMIT